MFDKVAIFGLGLIGGSIARNIRKNNLAQEVYGYDNNNQAIDFALKNNIISDIFSKETILGKNSLVVIATPLRAYHNTIDIFKNNLTDMTIIIDVGSVKKFVRTDILPILGDFAKNFIPCHPIAGSQRGGIKNAVNNLFQDKKIIITQNDLAQQETIAQVTKFWQKLDSKVEFLQDYDHDKIFALTSHLPQLLSYKLKNGNLKLEISNDVIDKHLRIEDSSLEIWRDIFDLNQQYLNFYIEEFKLNLKKINKLISNNHQELILSFQKYLQENNMIEQKNLALDLQDQADLGKILTRILVVWAFVKIPDINQFQSHYGSGFQDFTIILSYLEYFLLNEDLLINLLNQSQDKILDLF